jgi:hypothetical protein
MRHDDVWDKFQLGFWHPFGPYTGLSTAEVLEWKRDETTRYGWAFWSFAYSPTADIWLERLKDAKGPVYALCSYSPNARDPDRHKGALRATYYRWLDETEWQAMPDPDVMKVTNPFKRRGLALGFKVRRVIRLDPVIPPVQVEWFRKRDRTWCSDDLPTRGEFLVRKRRSALHSTELRRVEALLELVPPYLAVLTHLRGIEHAA